MAFPIHMYMSEMARLIACFHHTPFPVDIRRRFMLVSTSRMLLGRDVRKAVVLFMAEIKFIEFHVPEIRVAAALESVWKKYMRLSDDVRASLDDAAVDSAFLLGESKLVDMLEKASACMQTCVDQQKKSDMLVQRLADEVTSLTKRLSMSDEQHAAHVRDVTAHMRAQQQTCAAATMERDVLVTRLTDAAQDQSTRESRHAAGGASKDALIHVLSGVVVAQSTELHCMHDREQHLRDIMDAHNTQLRLSTHDGDARDALCVAAASAASALDDIAQTLGACHDSCALCSGAVSTASEHV
jgi:hypothetical protein